MTVFVQMTYLQSFIVPDDTPVEEIEDLVKQVAQDMPTYPDDLDYSYI